MFKLVWLQSYKVHVFPLNFNLSSRTDLLHIGKVFGLHLSCLLFLCIGFLEKWDQCVINAQKGEFCCSTPPTHLHHGPVPLPDTGRHERLKVRSVTVGLVLTLQPFSEQWKYYLGSFLDAARYLVSLLSITGHCNIVVHFGSKYRFTSCTFYPCVNILSFVLSLCK